MVSSNIRFIIVVAFFFIQTELFRMGTGFRINDGFFFSDQSDILKVKIFGAEKSPENVEEYFDIMLSDSVSDYEEGSGMGSGSGDQSEETLPQKPTSSAISSKTEHFTTPILQDTTPILDITVKPSEIEKTTSGATVPKFNQQSTTIDDEEGSGMGSGLGSGDGSDGSEETLPHKPTSSAMFSQTAQFTTAIPQEETSIFDLTVKPTEKEITSQIGKSNETTTEVNSISTTQSQQIEITTKITTDGSIKLNLLSLRLCGKMLYCFAGNRGPCAANEILVEKENASDDNSVLSCSAFLSFPWNTCYSNVSPHKALLSMPGKCVLKSKENPCSGLPANYRYDEKKKSCRPVSHINGEWLTTETCGDDQFFIGSKVNVGSCRCINKKYIQYAPDNRCYHPYTQGPCQYGNWLVPSSRSEMHCLPSPCPQLADGKHFFWNGHFYGPAGCYRSHTQGPCPAGKIFAVDNLILGHARCRHV